MPKKKLEYPDCPVETRYPAIQELAQAVADGKMDLVTVVGPPAQGKTEIFEQALLAKGGLFLRGGVLSLLKIHTLVFQHKDMPVCIDDHGMDKMKKQVVMGMCENKDFKRMEYHTFSKTLVEAGVPNSYTTSGAVAILCNAWDSDEPLCQALASRSHMIVFRPDWGEMYRYVGEWYWDQEIYDYVWERLENLKQPDLRIFTRASRIKRSGMKNIRWQDVIDAHVDDQAGVLVRQLLKDQRYKTNTARAKVFCDQTDMDRATFYRRLADIRAWQGEQWKKPEKITLRHTDPPVSERPPDSPVLPTGEEPQPGQPTEEAKPVDPQPVEPKKNKAKGKKAQSKKPKAEAKRKPKTQGKKPKPNGKKKAG